MRAAWSVAAALLLAACGRDEPKQPPPPAPTPALQFERAGNAVVHGERLARVLGCRGCHGDDLKGYLWVDDPQDVLLYSSNLRRAVQSYSDADLERAIRGGVRPDGSALWGMPSEIFSDLSAPDMAALIAYLRAQPPAGEAHPRPAFGPRARRDIAAGEWKPAPEEVRLGRGKGPPAIGGRHDWARYMIRATCSECHRLDLTGNEGREGHRGPPDLLVAGAYSRDQFRHLMRTGEPPDRSRDLGLMGQVARGRFAYLTTREVDSIYDYLAARAARPQ